MKNIRILSSVLLIFLSALALYSTTYDVDPANIKVGWDYTLPSFVKPSPYGAINTITGSVPGLKIKDNVIRRFEISWAQAEPQEGVYKFDSLKNEINKLVKNNPICGVELSIRGATYEIRWKTKASDPGTCPRWVQEKYSLPLIEENWSGNNGFQIVNLPIWNPDYHRHYLKFMEELGKSGIPHMPQVKSCYVHAISSSRGEEAEFGKVYWSEVNAGLSESIYLQTFYERFAAIADAFKGEEYKLMWVGKGNDNVYSGSGVKLINKAYELGMGQRSGFIEVYLMDMNNVNIGQKVDANGYLTTNEEIPPIRDRRRFGDENEEYGSDKTGTFGNMSTFPYRYKESMFRALQIRKSYLWVSNSSYNQNPALTDYVALQVGNDIYDTPDVWCYLRESYLKPTSSKPIYPVKNFERWVYQRDMPNGYTPVPDKKAALDPYYNNSGIPDPNRRYSFHARATSLETSNPKIGFAVDDRFSENYIGNYQLKITYFDEGTGYWTASYKNKSGEMVSHKVQLENVGGLEKTVTIDMVEPAFDAKDMEFDVVLESFESNVAFSFFRIIKTTEVNTGLITTRNSPLQLYVNSANELILNNNESGKLNIYNINGALCKTISKSYSQQVFPIGDLAKGIYLVSFIDKNNCIHNAKFIR